MSATRLLRPATAFFALAFSVHGVDHLRRGVFKLPIEVFIGGWAQGLLTVVTVVLVFRGRRYAPQFAAFLGFVSAIGFSAAHLLPPGGFFSDSFLCTDPAMHVTWFSWATAVLEIGAGLVLGVVGVLAARSREHADCVILARP